MVRIAVSQLHEGDYIDQPFVLQGKQLGQTSSNKPFLKADCVDATGSIHMRMWNITKEMYARLPAAGFVQVKGRIEAYQGHLQMIADSVAPIEDMSKLDLSELLKHTQKNVPEMLARVKEILSSIRDAELKLLVDAFLNDAELMKKFAIAPAAMNMHHAWLGGLLEHTLSLLELAVLICPRYPDIDRDVVLAGLFMHDLGKTVELSYGAGFDYTDHGRLIGHVVQGAMWVEQRAADIGVKRGKPLRRDLVMVLTHIILSHHGEPEFGAAVLPKTPEAILVNLIDNLDAKTQMAIDAVAAPAEESNWTDYHKAFNSKLYRPSITIHE